MSATPSTMSKLGSKAPNFQLPDTVTGNILSLAEIKGDEATVIMFICNHCPYVKHIESEVVKIANSYRDKGVRFVAISSNNVVKYPQDSPEKMRETALTAGYQFPYLYDETQEIAKSYEAACTPDFFLYDQSLTLVYRGQFDESRPGNDKPVTGKDICDALNAVIHRKPISSIQKPSIGCNIKWK